MLRRPSRRGAQNILGSGVCAENRRTIEHCFIIKDLGVEQYRRTLRTFRTILIGMGYAVVSMGFAVGRELVR
jgi:hypothetical protein